MVLLQTETVVATSDKGPSRHVFNELLYLNINLEYLCQISIFFSPDSKHTITCV